MNYSVAYQPGAIADYEQAVAWYKTKSKQASENFEAAVEERIDNSVVYLINEKRKQVVISSIYHHKRNPKKKYKQV
jgi:hypothetical protein